MAHKAKIHLALIRLEQVVLVAAVTGVLAMDRRLVETTMLAPEQQILAAVAAVAVVLTVAAMVKVQQVARVL